MKRNLTAIYPLTLALVLLTVDGLAQSGVNRQRGQQGKVPPVLRGKGPLRGIPGVGIPGDVQGGRNPRVNQQQFRRQQLMRALALTPNQVARMAEIRRRHEEDAIVVGRRLRQARQALERALYGEDYDEARIQRSTEELVAAQSEQIRLQARMNAEIRSVMTADQVRRFREKERQLKQEQRRRELLNQEDRPPGSDKTDGEEDDLFFWRLR